MWLIQPDEKDPITPSAMADQIDEAWSEGKLVYGPYRYFEYLFQRDQNSCNARADRNQMNVVTIFGVSAAEDTVEARASRDQFLDDVRAYLSRRYKHVR